MTEQLERELKGLFTEDAERAPSLPELAERVKKHAQRHRVRVAGTVGAVLATVGVVAAAVFSSGGLLGQSPIAKPKETPNASALASAMPTPHGEALWDDAVAECVEPYSPGAVRGRAFAFDGTAISAGPAQSEREGVELGVVAVTFTVHEWFSGGSSKTVVVDMPAPSADGNPNTHEVPSSYQIGSRLLISGEPRWGGANPLDDAIAWGCGFSRHYDVATANLWRAAME